MLLTNEQEATKTAGAVVVAAIMGATAALVFMAAVLKREARASRARAEAAAAAQEAR